MKKNNDFFITNLAAYTSPEILEVTGKDWVAYGLDNDYFNYLINLYLNSTSNNSIINGIVNMIYGRGLSALNADRRPDEYAQMMSLFKKSDLRRFIKDRKMLGMAAFQLVYQGGRVTKVEHFPMETLRAEKCNEDGEIEGWYYAADWNKINASTKPDRIPAFGYGNQTNGIELYVLKPYMPAHYYYTPVDYVGALPYAKLEDEIGDYLINDCINNFSGTKVVNFNNGVPDPEKMQQIKTDVLGKLTGSRGEKVIVAFNDNFESKTTVDDIPLNDAPEHYRYLAEECFRKLIVGHRVTSPMLLGIREGNDGLGNNAEEIKNATLLMDNIVIKCYQDEIIDCIDIILAINDITLELYFKTLKPLSFVDDIIDEADISDDAKEEETGIEMSSQYEKLDKETGEAILNALEGETISDEWDIVDERDFDYDNSSTTEWAKASITDIALGTIEKIKTLLAPKMINVGPINAKPNGFSYLDSKNYKIRYRYYQKSYAASIVKTKDGSPEPYESRPFCQNMMRLALGRVVYRIEDIDYASWKLKVNKSFGQHQKAYDLFRYKGGCYCRHAWKEVLYKRKRGAKVSDALINYRETGNIPSSYQHNPWGSSEAKKATFDLPNHGSLKYKY